MIDITLYRIRIGSYLPGRIKSPKFKNVNNSPILTSPINHYTHKFAFMTYVITIMYITLTITALTFSTNHKYIDKIHKSNHHAIPGPDHYNNFDTSTFSNLIYNAITYLLIIIIVNVRSLHKSNRKPFLVKLYNVLRYAKNSNSLSCYKSFRKYLIWITISNMILLTVCNMSITNPGPATKNNMKLSVFYQNVQGLIPIKDLGNENPLLNTTKVAELQAHIYKKEYDIVILNETWLTKNIHNNEIFSPNSYNVFREDRSLATHPADPNDKFKFRKNGGGVLIAIKTDIEVNPKKLNIKCAAEILTIELTLHDKSKICISTLYRVGTLGQENFMTTQNYYQNLLKNKKNNRFFLVGDLNLPNVNLNAWESGVCPHLGVEQNFVDLFGDLGLAQLVNAPTHAAGNILDLFLTNNKQHISNLSILNDGHVCKSDHFPISLNIAARVQRKKFCKKKVYNFKKANWDNLNLEFMSINWNMLLNSPDIETAWSKFLNTFHSTCNKHIPKVTAKSGFQPPWFDSDVYCQCREKDKWRAKYNKSKSDSHYLKYIDARSDLKKLIKTKMQANLMDGTHENAITKKFWSYVKSTSNSHRIPDSVHYRQKFRCEDKDKANLFNEYFFDQFSEASNYDININYNSNTDVSFDQVEIYDFLKNIDPNKCPGPDGVHGKILKTCANSLSLPLLILFRTSFFTCKIPNDWKLANVVPVHKKGSKNSVENYRPISLTSLVMKVYERVIRVTVMNKCKDRLDPSQHGFLPNKSCESQLIPFYDNLACTLNNSSRTDVVYFDFAKAFDSVNHDLILCKLKYKFNVDGFLLKFFVEYLKDRHQKVVINNIHSESIDVKSGVPQGSILGPILFVLFINDITNGLSKGTNIAMYADDTKIWREIVYDADHNHLQNDIDTLNDWATKNQMKFHPHKCKVLSVTLQRKQDDHPLPFHNFVYTLGNVPLDFVHNEKDLGVTFNTSLAWSEHCNSLYSKTSRLLGLLRRSCNFMKNSRQRRSLYIAIIRSQFEHCSIIWSPGDITSMDKLESIQKRAIKWIFSEEYASYDKNLYYLRCKELDLLPICGRMKLNDMKAFHKIIHNNSTVKLPHYISYFKGKTRLRSSHFDDLTLISSISPKTNMNYSKKYGIEVVPSSLSQFSNNFHYRAMNFWNTLPYDIRQISKPSQFELAVTKIIWERFRSQ